MIQEIAQRYQVESLLIEEADLLDRWKLDDWLQLFTDECAYEVGPLGVEDAETASSDDTLFLVADDRWRLERRVEMLQSPSAHVEWPHSRTRHIVSNVKLIEDGPGHVRAQSNLVVFRSKRGVTTTYMGHAVYDLDKGKDGDLRIRKKRVALDLDGLSPQGKVSIIL